MRRYPPTTTPPYWFGGVMALDAAGDRLLVSRSVTACLGGPQRLAAAAARPGQGLERTRPCRTPASRRLRAELNRPTTAPGSSPPRRARQAPPTPPPPWGLTRPPLPTPQWEAPGGSPSRAPWCPPADALAREPGAGRRPAALLAAPTGPLASLSSQSPPPVPLHAASPHPPACLLNPWPTHPGPLCLTAPFALRCVMPLRSPLPAAC